MKGRPARKQHDLDRHDRDRPPRNLAEQCEQDTCEYVAPPGAATGQDRGPGAYHMRGVDRVASRLQREIGLYRSAEIGSAPVEQRPAAVRALDRANIPRDPPLQFRLDTTEIVLEQDEF